jgi:hypothetical protein
MEVLGHVQLPNLAQDAAPSSIRILQITDSHAWWPSQGPIDWKTNKGKTVHINEPGSPYTTTAESGLLRKIVSNSCPGGHDDSAQSHILMMKKVLPAYIVRATGNLKQERYYIYRERSRFFISGGGLRDDSEFITAA